MTALFPAAVFFAVFFLLAGVFVRAGRNPVEDGLTAFGVSGRRVKGFPPPVRLLKEYDELLPAGLFAAVLAATVAFGVFRQAVPALAAGGAVFFLVPGLHARFRKKRYKGMILQQIGPAANVLTSVVRGGGSILQALDHAAREVPDPFASELRRTAEDIRAGTPFHTAAGALAGRVNLPEARVLSDALSMLAETGGHGREAVRLLEGASDFIRERNHLKMRIRAATGNVRFGFIVASLIPVVMSVTMYVAMPEYRAAFATGQGKAVAGAGIVFLAAGWFLVARLLKSGEESI
jgi:Flp pilus assembly protein TadB